MTAEQYCLADDADSDPNDRDPRLPGDSDIGPNLFRNDGEFWTIAYAGDSCHLRDTKGMAYLAVLLARPHLQIHATALLAAPRDSTAAGAAVRAEVDPAAAERARVNVSRAINGALRRIAQHLPPLAEHLQQTVHTGTFCRYAPDPRQPLAWKF